MNRTTAVFDELASKWDEKSKYIEGVYNGESERLMKCIPLYLRDGMRVADLGCGTGRVVEHILRTNKNVEVIAVDSSSEMIEVASRKFSGLHNVRCVNSNLEEFDDTEGFDIIFLAQVIHHLDNPKGVMSHITSLLKPDGIIVLMVIGEEHMCDVVRYNGTDDVLGRFDTRMLLDLFSLDSQSYCRIFDDHFKMKFRNVNDFGNFMTAVSLTPKMNGYEMCKSWNAPLASVCFEDGSPLVSGHYYTLVYKKGVDAYGANLNFKKSIVDAYNEWSANYSNVVMDKLERRGYGYDELAELIYEKICSAQKRTILEIGAGTGLVGERIRKRNKDIVLNCVEISSSMASCIKAGTYDEVYITDFENFFPDKQEYDCVYTTFMMHHSYSIDNVLSRIHSIMRENSILIVVDLLLNGEGDFNNKMHSEIHEYGAGVNYYKKNEFEEKLLDNGFEIFEEKLLGRNVGLAHWMFVAGKGELV